MKTKFRTTKRFFRESSFLLFLGFILFAASCKKDKKGDDGNGVQITKVYKQGDSEKKAITSALPGTNIVIEGKNLSAATVHFGSKQATIDPLTNLATTILVTIPQDAEPDANGTLKVTTPAGSATFSFAIEAPPVPAPIIQSISNENAVTGEVVIVKGQHLGTVTSVKLPGGQTVSSVSVNAGGTELTYTAPNMGTASGKMELVSPHGNAVTIFDVNLNKGDYYLISNLDEKNYYNNQTAPLLNDASLFPGNRGKYIRHNLPALPSNSFAYWNPGEARRAIFANIPVWDVIDKAAELSNTASNYAFKFEINTRTAWSNPMHLVFFFNGKVNDSNYGMPNVGGPQVFGYPWKPVPSDQTFNTNNKWQTVTIPLDLFKNATSPGVGDLRHPNGNALGTLSQIIAASGQLPYFEYRFYTVGADGNSEAATQPIDVAFDNFRIVKIK